MIIVMKAGASAREIGHVTSRIDEMGFQVHLSEGTERTIIGVIGDERPLDPAMFEVMDGVEKTVSILPPYKLASREFRREDTVIPVRTTRVGGEQLAVIAGPCSVESRGQLLEIAHAVKEAGATMLRGGAFKPRTSPYAFQGLGEEGLELLAEAREATGLPDRHRSHGAGQGRAGGGVCRRAADRRAQHAELPAAAGGGSISAAGVAQARHDEHDRGTADGGRIHPGRGNYNVMLCERGIRTFETYTRNTTDINAIPALKHLSHLPVIGDPSHGTGKWALVAPVAKALVAAGVDGLMIEVHQDPEHALSDGAQSLKPERFAALIREIRVIAEAVGRSV